MAYIGLSNAVRNMHWASQFRRSPHLLGSCRSYSRVISTGSILFWILFMLFYFNRGWIKLCLVQSVRMKLLAAVDVHAINYGGIFSSQHESQNAPLLSHPIATCSLHAKITGLSIGPNGARTVTIQAKAPAQARQMGALKVTMLSPGFVYEPYPAREPVAFWWRLFTRSGWRRTKEDIIVELKSAYAIAKLRKTGYSKQKFYTEAIELYKEINFLLPHGDKKNLRKIVTERMFSNDIKQIESMWSKVYWEMVEPAVKIRTLQARLIGFDKSDLNKVFVQLTLEFLTKQKFEAYDSNGAVVTGDKSKEVGLVRESLLVSQKYLNAMP